MLKVHGRGPAVLWDAIVVLNGANSVASLSKNALALEFMRMQYRHCKAMLVFGAASALLDAASVPTDLPDKSPDAAQIVTEDGAVTVPAAVA